MLKPFFPYFGSKWRDARYYPAPLYDHVIEPFAGSAGYATWHEPAMVSLFDLDPVLVGVWGYLVGAAESEILALPDLAVGQSVDDFRLPQEAKWLIGFWLNRGSASPKKTRTAYSARIDRQQLVWGQRARERIASQVGRIRHWRVYYGSYQAAPRVQATWFVDPPYIDKGRYYRVHDVEYDRLGAWCQRLLGQAVVCEQAGADWLPFQPFRTTKSTRGTSAEVIWTNA